eukprot:2413118-Pyramimonas_sp.AAC.2
MVADTSPTAKPGAKVADYWEASTKLLADPTGFLDSLMTYDKENIPADVIKKISPYIDREDFTPEAISKVSKACTSICMWARAMHTYYLGYDVDGKGYDVDVKGYDADCKGCDADVKGYDADGKGYDADGKGCDAD